MHIQTGDTIMKRHQLISALALTGMLFSGGAAVAADIVKCVDHEGHATLTDQVCAGGEMTEAPREYALAQSQSQSQTYASDEAVAEEPVRPAVTHVTLSTGTRALPPKSWEATHVARAQALRGPSPDMMTIKAAHMTMQMLDEQSHQSKLVASR